MSQTIPYGRSLSLLLEIHSHIIFLTHQRNMTDLSDSSFFALEDHADLFSAPQNKLNHKVDLFLSVGKLHFQKYSNLLVCFEIKM